ncbi:MAG: hypothetical protein ACUVV5_02685 [Candidatus Aminicenantales bacterium]
MASKKFVFIVGLRNLFLCQLALSGEEDLKGSKEHPLMTRLLSFFIPN